MAGLIDSVYGFALKHMNSFIDTYSAEVGGSAAPLPGLLVLVGLGIKLKNQISHLIVGNCEGRLFQISAH